MDQTEQALTGESTQRDKAIDAKAKFIEEMAIYEKNTGCTKDAFSFWRDAQPWTPVLLSLEKAILAIPATSVPSERLLSHAGFQNSDRRINLRRKTAQKVMHIYEK